MQKIIRFLILTILILSYLYPGQAVFAASLQQTSDGTIHVALTGTNSPGCGSEVSPCRTLQYAINLAQSGDTILVAEGTYTYSNENPSSTCLQYSINPSVACIVTKHLSIFGGYSQTNWSADNPQAHLTIIDGQNQYRGISVIGGDLTNTKASLVLEGFTIRNGLAQGKTTGQEGQISGYGGGLYTNNAAFTLRNVIFQSNRALGGNTTTAHGGAAAGAGLAVVSIPSASQGTLENITFDGNQAIGGNGPIRGGCSVGGGFYIWQGAVNGTNLTLTNNLAQGGNSTGNGWDQSLTADGLGGGGAVHFNTTVTLQHLIATGNRAVGGNAGDQSGNAHGGGLFVEGAWTMNLIDAVLKGNSSTGGVGQHAGLGGGGGITLAGTPAVIDRAIIVANTAKGGAGSVVKGSAGGGGVYAMSFTSSPAQISISNSVIADNYIEMGSGSGNPGGGGGGIWLQGILANLTHTTISNNRMEPGLAYGAAILLLNFSAPISTLNLSYSVISDHKSTSSPNNPQAALHVWKGNVINLNTIAFANNSKDTNQDGKPSNTDGPGTINGLSTIINLSSTGFIAPASPNYNYHLTQSSALRDRANNSQTGFDLDGQARPYNGISDIGADEYKPFPLSVIPGNGVLHLNWQAASTILAGVVNHYEIQVSCASGCSNNPINAGQSTSYTLGNLVNFQQYSITVSALDNNSAIIAPSESITNAPTDLFVYLPLTIRH